MADPDPQTPKDQNWPKDEFGRGEVLWQMWQFWSVLLIIVLALLFAVVPRVLTKGPQPVVAYCAQDQVYAEAIFRDFEKETGLKIRPVFDSEAVKTVGLANRLLAERSHPQCDLFWGNEEMRTRQLAAEGVFRAENGWAAFGYRSRRIAINTNLVSESSAPRSLLELTNSNWHGKVALAYPQFGTTATHFHALRQHWGDGPWQTWCKALAANKPLLVDGNSVVVKLVGAGQATIGLTDSDDIASGRHEGLPVAALPMNEETLLIPNTAGITRDAPHIDAAVRLMQYLQRPETLGRLVKENALEGISITEVQTPTLQVDWNALLRDLESTTEKLNKIFLR